MDQDVGRPCAEQPTGEVLKLKGAAAEEMTGTRPSFPYEEGVEGQKLVAEAVLCSSSTKSTRGAQERPAEQKNNKKNTSPHLRT